MAEVSILMLPEPGHYLPTLRIAHTLRSLGNTVSYVTLPHYEAFFRKHGFVTHVIDIPGLPDWPVGDIFAIRSTGGVVLEYLNRHLNNLKISFPDFISRELSRRKCDLLICDSGISKYIGSVVGEISRQVVVIHITIPEEDSPSDGAVYHEVVLCPYELEIPKPSLLMTTRRYGESSIYRERQTCYFPWHELQDNKPLVYCSFGSQAASYPLAIDALKKLVSTFAQLSELQFVLVANASHRPQLPQVIPPNVILVGSAPQPELLDRAVAFITHGGLGSIKEAILACVPTVVIPFAFDQPSNAKRVEHHGLGYACMPEDCTSQRIADLLTDVQFSEGIRHRLEAMSCLFTKIEHEAPISTFVNKLLTE